MPKFASFQFRFNGGNLPRVAFHEGNRIGTAAEQLDPYSAGSGVEVGASFAMNIGGTQYGNECGFSARCGRSDPPVTFDLLYGISAQHSLPFVVYRCQSTTRRTALVIN